MRSEDEIRRVLAMATQAHGLNLMLPGTDDEEDRVGELLSQMAIEVMAWCLGESSDYQDTVDVLPDLLPALEAATSHHRN